MAEAGSEPREGRKSSFRRQPIADGVVPPKRIVRLIEEEVNDPLSDYPTADTPRRAISFPSTPLQSGDNSPTQQFSPSSRMRGPKAHIINNIRLTRREFFESIGPQKSKFSFAEARSCTLKCSALASISAALSYVHTYANTPVLPLTPKGQNAAERAPVDTDHPLPVTIDQILRCCELPFSALTSNETTVHTAFDILSRFMKEDATLQDYSAVLEPMDLRITEALMTPMADFDSAPREPAVDLKNLRQRLQETQGAHTFVVIVFYDHRIVEDSLTVEEDEDENVNCEMNKSFLAAVLSPELTAESDPQLLEFMAFRENQTKTEAAVVVGITRNDRVQLAIPKFTESRSGMQIMDVSMATLHRGMSAAHPYSDRANGFLVIKRAGTGLTTPALSGSLETQSSPSFPDPPNVQTHLAPTPIDVSEAGIKESARTPRVSPRHVTFRNLTTFARNLASPLHVQLNSVGTSVGSHITAIALAKAALDHSGSGGLDLTSIVHDLRCPFESITQSLVAVEEVGAMCKKYFANRPNAKVTIVPFAQNVQKTNAPCSMSVADFQNSLSHLNKVNERSNRAVMLAQFDVGFVHWTVDITHVDTSRTHWGILTNFNPEDDTIEVIDTLPSKFGFVWTVDVEQLHRAMTNLGYVVVSQDGVDVSAFKPATISNVVEIADSCAPYISPLATAHPRHAIATIYPGAPLSLAGTAIATTFPTANFSGLLAHFPVSIVHALDNRIELHDYARCLQAALNSLQVAATVKSHTFLFTLTSGSEDECRQRFNDIVDSADRGDRIVIFNFLPTGVTGFYQRVLKGPSQPTDYALLLGTVGDDHLSVVDTNAAPSKRYWVAPRSGMYDAVSREHPLTHRPLGIITVDLNPSREDAPAGALHRLLPIGMQRFHTPALTPFLPHSVPSVEALAMTFTAFGIPCTAEEVLYTHMQNCVGDDVRLYAPTSLQTSEAIVERTIAIAEGYGRRRGQIVRVSRVEMASEAELLSLCTDVATDSSKTNGRPSTVLILVYACKDIHSQCSETLRGAGLVSHATTFSAGVEPAITVLDATPAVAGELWSRPIAEIAYALRSPLAAIIRIDSNAL
jgi:hypothetical protein